MNGACRHAVIGAEAEGDAVSQSGADARADVGARSDAAHGSLARLRAGAISIGLLSVVASLGIGCSEPESSADAAARTTAAAETAVPDASGGEANAGNAKGAPPVERSQEQLVAAGRSVYNANCISCHSMDPSQDGAIGPAVAGSSYELIEARVLRGEYPQGYEPKRGTRVMVALPFLEPELGALAAYLNSIPSRS